jgi:uncharacterized membrane protein
MRIGLNRALLAVAAASLAIFSLAYGGFAPSGQSLPGWVAGRDTWVHLFALLLLAASAGVCFTRSALPSALTIGAYQMLWAMIGIPAILAGPLSFGGWYGFCEALTSLVGTWIVYAMLRWQSRARGVRAAQVLFGLTCIFYGCSHFAYADYTASMVPGWLPYGLGFAYFTGLGHIAAGLGITAGILPRLAATLEAIMMSLFGLLVWVPSFFAQPRPKWAGTSHNQWSELIVNVSLAAAAWIVADSLRNRSWSFGSRSRA